MLDAKGKTDILHRLKALDLDHDGKISREEWLLAATSSRDLLASIALFAREEPPTKPKLDVNGVISPLVVDDSSAADRALTALRSLSSGMSKPEADDVVTCAPDKCATPPSSYRKGASTDSHTSAHGHAPGLCCRRSACCLSCCCEYTCFARGYRSGAVEYAPDVATESSIKESGAKASIALPPSGIGLVS